MYDPRREVRWFSRHMERKLQPNDRKGGWGRCSLQYLSMRLTQERKELAEAIKSGDRHRIVTEAADVANFAMMTIQRIRPVETVQCKGPNTTEVVVLS